MKTTIAFLIAFIAPAAVAAPSYFAGDIDRNGVERTVAQALGEPRLLILANSTYARVDEAQLPALHKAYVAELYRATIPAAASGPSYAACWDFVAFAQRQLFTQYWRRDVIVNRPAIFPVVYRMAGRPEGQNLHAVLLVITGTGYVFWDPQCGRIELTAGERETVRFPQG